MTHVTYQWHRVVYQVAKVTFICALAWFSHNTAARAALTCADGQYLIRAELIDFYEPSASGDGMTGMGYLEDANGFTWLTFGDLPAWTGTPLFSIQEVCVPLGTYTFAYFVDSTDLYPEELFFWIYVNDIEVLFGGGGISDNYYSTVIENFYLDVFWVKKGCTNPTATNYDPQAPIDDGTCVCPNNEEAIDLNITIFDTYGEGNDGYGSVADLDGNLLYLTDIYWNQNCESFGYLSAEDWQAYCSGNLSQTNGPYALCPGDYIFNHSINYYPEEFSFELSTENGVVGFGDYQSLPYPFQLGNVNDFDAGQDDEEITETTDAGDEHEEEITETIDAGEDDVEEITETMDAGGENEEEITETMDASSEEDEITETMDAGLIGVELLPPPTQEDEVDPTSLVQVESGCQCSIHANSDNNPLKNPFFYLSLCFFLIWLKKI